jgi:hypothetical protein
LQSLSESHLSFTWKTADYIRRQGYVGKVCSEGSYNSSEVINRVESPHAFQNVIVTALHRHVNELEDPFILKRFYQVVHNVQGIVGGHHAYANPEILFDTAYGVEQRGKVRSFVFAIARSIL